MTDLPAQRPSLSGREVLSLRCDDVAAVDALVADARAQGWALLSAARLSDGDLELRFAR